MSSEDLQLFCNLSGQILLLALLLLLLQKTFALSSAIPVVLLVFLKI